MITKKSHWGLEGLQLSAQEILQLEPVAIFLKNEKKTSNTVDSLQFWVHQQLAKELFSKVGIMTPLGFKEFPGV